VLRERGNEGKRKDRVGSVVRATRTTVSKGLRRIHSVRAPPNGGGLDPRRVRRVARWIRRIRMLHQGGNRYALSLYFLSYNLDSKGW